MKETKRNVVQCEAAEDGSIAEAQHPASDRGNVEVLQMLLQYKADFNIPEDDAGRHMTQCIPEWIYSRVEKKGNPEVVRLLLDHGADVHVHGNQDRDALWWAVERGHHEIAQLLREHGAGGKKEDCDE
ncbi:hypothetical protein BGW80DRAFT_1556565 [Lactifluus volemus]|nr:hypothetical protein BGW80DRAFT_1556565 [Lactifluus volemus]